MKKLWSQKILKLKPSSRAKKKKKLEDKPKRKVNRRKIVPKYSRQELINWGKEHKVRVVRDIWRMASIYEDCPTFMGILSQFGSWKEYKRHLEIDNQMWYWKGRTDEDYIKLCVNLGMDGTLRDYREKMKKYGGILVCHQKIRKKFGNWTNFKKLIRCYNLDMLIYDYVSKSIECGHPLTLRQCQEYGIQIKRAMDSYGKKIFNRIVREKEKQIYLEMMQNEN